MTYPPPIASPLDWMQALHSSDSAWVLIDAQGYVVSANDGLTRLLGYTLQEVRQRPLLPLLLGIACEQLLPSITEQLSQTGAFCGELQLHHSDGRPIWVSATINMMRTLDQPTSEGLHTAQVLVFTDIGATKRFEVLQRQMLEDVVKAKPLSELMAHMCRELERMIPAVRVSVMQLDENGRLQLLAAPGLPKHLVEQLQSLRIGPNVGSCGVAAFLGHEVITPDIGQDTNWATLAPWFLQAGLRACWSSPVKNYEEEIIGTLAFYFDNVCIPSALHRQLVQTCLHLCRIAMGRDEFKRRIRQLACYDSLTRLPNRAMFNECAKRVLHAAHGRQSVLFFVDLDRFKLVNDTLGHAVGDALLREIAGRLRQCTRPGDIVGRLSSDEFAILLPDCSTVQIAAFAQRFLDCIAQPFSVNGIVTIPNASMGASVYPDDGADIEVLLRYADQAMYAAKQQGSHHWQRYTPELGRQTQERVDMEHALYKALCENELTLYYQPQVSSTSPNALVGVEALARWHHREWGWVSPQRFVAVAEDADLIHALTRWLLDAACAQLARWRAQKLPVPHVSVNLSTRNFHDPQFATQVQQTLSRYGLHPLDLILEITESVMLDTSHATQANLHNLHANGMRLSLDDFGTGYSSLSYLLRLPIAELKLDKSFVQDITTSVAASALTRSVLDIGSRLGMTVVAEGVETGEQAQWLYQHGCPILQGYLFAKPLPPQQLEDWLEQQLVAVKAA